MKRRSCLLMAGFALTAASSPAMAQDWPKGPVRVVVPFDARSTPDLVARVVAERLAARLGQPMIVDNKSGTSGNIGTDAVAKAAPERADMANNQVSVEHYRSLGGVGTAAGVSDCCGLHANVYGVSEDFSEFTNAGIPATCFFLGGLDARAVASMRAAGKGVVGAVLCATP